jgi:hypothetical protein
MNPCVVDVVAQNNYTLILTFDNEEVRIFDANPFLDRGIFSELKDCNYFKQVKVVFGAVEWPHEQDFSKDTLYLLSASLDD